MRNKDYKKTKKRVKRQTNGDGGLKDQTQTQRIKSYDYQAWDKFDVVIRFCILIHIHDHTNVQNDVMISTTFLGKVTFKSDTLLPKKVTNYCNFYGK